MGNYAYAADYSSLIILRFDATGIIDGDELPSRMSLEQNYPNPLNAQTTIQYSLPKQSMVSIYIFDILGRRIVHLSEGTIEPGNYEIT